ncbi:MAG: DEAD/DEAH box helicase, partial [Bacteroidales bacterium]|nr:DEAD/DEAH box helicase [Bacteroidales bacterium]
MPALLDTPITYLAGVGPQRAASLQTELGISTFGDLAYYFPYKYVDKSRFYYTTDIRSDAVNVQLKGVISNFRVEGEKHKQRLVARFTDEKGSIELIWFKGIQWIQQSIIKGKEYIIYGKPNYYNGAFNIAHPEIDDPIKVQQSGMQYKFSAQYSVPEGLKNNKFTSKAIAKLVQNLWKAITSPIPETLPKYLLDRLHLMNLTDALRAVHLPKSDEQLNAARARLKFEELFYIQLNILRFKRDKMEKSRGFIFKTVGDAFNTFYSKYLPFQLTNAQKRVVKEIRADFLTGRQSNRLIQGDVGSGKTLVALLSMLIAIDNGFQACIMAPTEILANQHYDTIRELLKDMPLQVALL